MKKRVLITRLRCRIAFRILTLVVAVLSLSFCGDGTAPNNPHSNGPDPLHLRPISEAQAEEMAAYIRKSLVQEDTSRDAPVPVSWSYLDCSCEDRMMLAQVVLARLAMPAEIPITFCPEDFAADRLAELKAHPAIDSGGILIFAGPDFGPTQALLHYDGTPASDKTRSLGWLYHEIPVVNVQKETGTCYMVLDLSAGNKPLEIDAWLSTLVEGGCDYDPETDIGSEAPVEPQMTCTYRFTELFYTFGFDDPTLIPGNLTQDSGLFLELLGDYWGIDNPKEEDLPYYLSRLTPE